MLEGKSIVVIGGTTGLGRSAAQGFIAHGAKVVVTGLNGLEEATGLIGDAGLVLGLDARTEGTAEQAIDACERQYGSFHGLYHVAGGSGRRFGDGPLHELTLDGWNATLDLNLTALMLSNRAAIRRFRANGRGGVILNMGSVLGFSPSVPHFITHAYAAAKSAVIGFSKSIAACYASENIRVNVIAPGLAETPMSARAAGDEKIMSFIRTKQPLDGGRIGQPGDLDGLASLLMSDHGSYITGQVVAVDGGWSVSEGQHNQ